MLEMVKEILPYIPSNVIGLLLLIAMYLYFKYKVRNIETDRTKTKESRDSETTKIHDTLLKHSFEIDSLKLTSVHHSEVLDDIRQELGVLNTEVAKLGVSIDKLAEFLHNSK